MSREPEEQAAVERIEAAIEGYLKLFPQNRFLTGWMVLTTSTGVDDDGDDNTRYAWIFPPRGLAWHLAFGMMDVHRLLMQAEMREADG